MSESSSIAARRAALSCVPNQATAASSVCMVVKSALVNRLKPMQQVTDNDATRDRLQREIACPAVSGIDQLVYDLYGLTAEEIRIVEGK